MVTEQPTSFLVAMTPGLMGPLLFGPFALGLLIYIYAFCSQAQQRRNFGQSLLLSIKQKESHLQGVQNTHPILFTLLVLDAFTAIFGIVLGVYILGSLCFELQLIGVWNFANPWLSFRWLSVSQHLITALISILVICRPEWGSTLLIVGKVLNLPPFILVMGAYQFGDSILIVMAVYNLLLTLAVVVSCLLKTSSTMADQRKSLGLLAVITYICVCLPNSVLNCLMFHSRKYLLLSVDVLFTTNFYFILNALLFYFALQINEEEQQEYEGAIRSAEEKVSKKQCWK